MHSDRIDIITVGDELIEGRVIDTHSAYLSAQLDRVGLPVARHLSVGDDLDFLVEALRDAAARSSVVLVTGGLGPTTDDRTAEAASKAFGRPRKLEPEARAQIEAFFAAMGREMTDNNLQQARLPSGARVIENACGTAPGFSLKEGDARFYFLPGVPQELRAMFEQKVLPDLVRTLRPRPRRVRMLATFGMGESRVGNLLEGLEAEAPGRLLVQYRVTFPEVHVRLCLSGFDIADPAGDQEMERIEHEALERLGAVVFDRGARTLPEVVLALLQERAQDLATAESCTGGLVSEILTEVPGASRGYAGGVVAYANEAKVTLLGVDPDLIETHGAVSAPVAEAMARGARARFDTTWAVSITGIAGPTGGTEQKPVGTVFLAVDGPHETTVRRACFPGDRHRVRRFAAWEALDLLRRRMLHISPERVS